MSPAAIQDIEALKQRLAPHVRPACKVIIFGSVARGEADQWSDLDLVIVADTSRPFLERYRDFQLYVPTRHPNGLPGGLPADAISQAARFVERATGLTR